MNKRVHQITAFACLFCHLVSTTIAQGPAWWISRGVIDPGEATDDYAVANQGQLKNFAAAAAAQMAVLPNGGAGLEVKAMIQDWHIQQAQADDYAAATVGQAKAVAAKFYQRLQQLGLSAMPPWTGVDSDDDNHAAINLGQLKSLFAFVIPAAPPRAVTFAELNMSPPTLLGSSMSDLLNRGDRSRFGFSVSGIAGIPSVLRSTGESGGLTSFPGKVDKSKIRVEFSNRSYWYSWYWSNSLSSEVVVVEGASSGIGYEHDPDFYTSPSWWGSRWTVKHYMTNRPIMGSGSQSTNNLKNVPGYRLIELFDLGQFPGTAAVWTTPRELNFDDFNHKFGRNSTLSVGIGEFFNLNNAQNWAFDYGYNPPKRLGAFNVEDTRLAFSSFSFTIKLTEPVSYAVRVPLTEYVTDRNVVTGNRTHYAEFDPGQTTSDPIVFHSKMDDFKFVDGSPENHIDVGWLSYLELGEPEPAVADSPPLRQLDIAGPARRKIALNGVPLPDEQPQKSPESDQPKEESYIDGYNLALNHSISDVFVPQGASQFPLAVERHAQEVTWTTRSDLPVRERMTDPFGQGWGSNLCSYVDFRRDSNGAARAVTVVDENGSSQQFLDLGNEYEILPFSATDVKSFMNTLKKETINGETCLVYEKKYGTRLVFESRKVVTRADDLPEPDRDAPLSYTLGHPSSGSTFASPGFLPGGSWSRQIIADNAGTPGVWKHEDGTEVTLTAGNLAYVRGVNESGEEGVYVSLVEREEATDLGLHWDELEKGVPEWTTDGADSGAAGQASTLKGTHLKDALEVRNKKSVAKSYSKGTTSSNSLPSVDRLPSVWGANKTGLSGIVSPPPVNSKTLAFAPVSADYLRGYVRSLRDVGGAFLEHRGLPIKQVERSALFSGIANGMLAQGPKIASLNASPGWKSGYQAATNRQVGFVNSLAAKFATRATDSTTIQRKNNFVAAGNKIGAGGRSLQSVASLGFMGTLEPEEDTPEVPIDYSDYDWVEHSYHRLAYVEDRLGNRLNYHYPDDNTLIPDRITDSKRSDAVLTVTHNGQRISSIKDPRGNEVQYRYRTVTIDQDQITMLERVTYPDGSFVHYGYDHDAELDRTADAIVHHLNLGAILNPEGHAWNFHYDFAINQQDLATPRPESKEGGLPRWVSCVTLPDGKKATFANDRIMMRTPDGMLLGRISNSVCDVDGTVRTYTFGGAQLAQAPSRAINGDVTKATGVENYLMFTTLDIHLGQDMVESFEFDPEAGLALKSATDLSGHTTTWEYKDLGPFYDGNPNTEVENGFKVSAPLNLFRYHNDPTAKINALNQRTEYTYHDTTRVMDSIKDPLGRKTVYTIDESTGLRTEEKHYKAAPYSGAATVVESHTVYEYVHATFKGFLTQVTKKKLAGDPAWAADLSTTYTPDNQGRVASETVNGIGATTSFTYDANGNKETVTDPLGHVTRFAYDGRGRLKSVIYAEGTADQARKDYTYDSRGNKIVEVDENNGTTFRVYDEMNREVLTTFDLNGNGVPDGRDQDIVTTTAFNPFGQPEWSMNPNGVITENEYDGLGRLCVTRVAVGTLQEAETHFFYESNNGGSVFDTSTFKPNRVVDARGYQSVTEYDALYRPTTVWRQYLPGAASNTADPGFWAKTLTAYDYAGNVWIVTDPKGLRTETIYDSLNRPVETRTGNFGAGSPPDQQRVSTTSYTSTGLAWKSVDPMGRVTETEYDAAGRAVKKKLPDLALPGNAPIIPIAQTDYDLAGNVTSVTDPLGRVTTTAYDARNRPVSVTAPAVLDAATGEMTQPVVHTVYDAGGRVVRVTDPLGGNTDTYFDRAGRAEQVQSPAVAVYGRPAVAVTAINSTYDKVGNVLTVTDAEGRTTYNFYDPLNRLYQTNDAAGIPTAFGYDAAGNRTSVTDGKGQMTIFAYDGLNRLLMDQPPIGSPTLHYYDVRDKLHTVFPDGKAVGYNHDLFGQLTAVNVLKKMGNATQFGYFYDKTWRNLTYDKVGNLLSSWESEMAGTFTPKLTSTTYTYDAHNRRITEKTGKSGYSGGGGITTAYNYDLVGNRTRMSVPGSNDLDLFSTYDALNRLAKLEERRAQSSVVNGSYVWTHSPVRTTTWEYDLAGRTHAQDLANGTRIVNTHDAQGRLTARTLSGLASAGRPVLSQQSYLYDATANLRTMSEQYAGQATARTVTNTYDAALRLDTEQITEADGTSTLSNYDYDDAGNRTQLTKTTGAAQVVHVYSHNELNQLTGFTKTGAEAVSYTYDANGNRATRTQGTQTDTYTWDVENRLVQIAHAATAKTYRYGYDHRTRRVIRQEGTETTLVQHAGGTSFAEWTLPTGAVLPSTYGSSGSLGTATLSKVFIRGSDMGGGVGGLLYSEKVSSSTKPTVTISNNASTWTQTNISNLALAPSLNHYNGRGDVVAKTDASGSVTWTGSYEAFGTRTRETGTNDDRQRANTKDEDPTGLLNEGFRYRDLETGTWLSRDPAGFVDGPNLYAYVRANPWSKFDPNGLWIEDAVLGVPSIGVGGASLWSNAKKGHVGSAIWDAVGIVVDGVAIAVPGVPGGVGLATKAARLATAKNKVENMIDTAETVADVATAVATGDPTALVEVAADIALDKAMGGKKSKNSSSADAPKPSKSQKDTVEDSGANVHGNSDSSTKAQHVYEIRDPDGNLVKVGISGQPLNENGSSPRANRQTSGTNNTAEVVETIPAGEGARKKAKAIEQQRVDDYAKENDGNGPPGNKLPRPTTDAEPSNPAPTIPESE